jgi:hypothetical protein
VRGPPESVDAATSNAHDAFVFVAPIDCRTQIDACDGTAEALARRPIVASSEDTVAPPHVVERADDDRQAEIGSERLAIVTERRRIDPKTTAGNEEEAIERRSRPSIASFGEG